MSAASKSSVASKANSHATTASKAGTKEASPRRPHFVDMRAPSEISANGSNGGKQKVQEEEKGRPQSARAPSKAASAVLSPRMSVGGSTWGTTRSVKSPTGPFVHGDDIRYVRPKKRGGIAKMSGIKALHPSGKLMGSEVRAWWPDPPVEEEEDELGRPSSRASPITKTLFTDVMRSSPYAVGKTLDTYDRRTFDPKMSNGDWQQAVQKLQMASTKLSEMERSMRNGLQLMAAASQAASLASSKQTQSRAPSFLSSSNRSRANGSEASYARSALSARSWAEEMQLQSSNKVSDWIDSQRPARSRKLPAYSKIVEAERNGDQALRSMRDQKTVARQQHLRANPPSRTRPEIRPFETVTAKYVAPDGKYMLREKRVFVDAKALTKDLSRASQSPGESPRRDPLGPGPAVPREVVDDCQKTLGRAMTPKRREETVGAQIWNKFKGEQDPPEFRAVRVVRGPEEQALARNIRERPHTARVGARSAASASSAASPRSPKLGAGPGGSRQGTPRSSGSKGKGGEGGAFSQALASAGLEVGNPLLADQRVTIQYQL